MGWRGSCRKRIICIAVSIIYSLDWTSSAFNESICVQRRQQLNANSIYFRNLSCSNRIYNIFMFHRKCNNCLLPMKWTAMIVRCEYGRHNITTETTCAEKWLSFHFSFFNKKHSHLIFSFHIQKWKQLSLIRLLMWIMFGTSFIVGQTFGQINKFHFVLLGKQPRGGEPKNERNAFCFIPFFLWQYNWFIVLIAHQ